MIKIDHRFILSTAGEKLNDLLMYTMRDSISMLIGGAIMLLFLGETPFYNPKLVGVFIAVGLIFGFTTVFIDTVYDMVWPDKA